jgi:hypothetical protein
LFARASRGDARAPPPAPARRQRVRTFLARTLCVVWSCESPV